MASGPGYLVSELLQDQLSNQLRVAGTYTGGVGVRGVQYQTTLYALNIPVGGIEVDLTPPAHIPVHGPGAIADNLGSEWFEKVHLLPRSIDFGQILTTQSVNIELFNAFRNQNVSLNGVVINVGEGLSITNLPMLPDTILYLDGLVLNIEATTDGVPNFDGTIDFQLDVYTLTLPVTGLRVVVFPFAPESPLVERLLFATNVLESKSGQEQRINLRLAPRQEFDLRIVREEIFEKNQIEFILFDWHERAFGIPIWYEPTILTVNALIDDVTVTVESTAYADYRVGGLAIIITDEGTFDSLEVASITATTLTFTSGLLHNYAVGTRVYPLRSCYATKMINGSRYQKNAAEYTLRMRVVNNEVSIASAAAFSTFNGKVLVDDFNFIPEGSLPLVFERSLIDRDSYTGKFSQQSTWDRDKRSSQKGWAISGSRQKLWEVRQLLHYLKGKQTAFYLPTFQWELVVTQTLLNLSDSMTIRNVGYSKYIRNRSPNNVIRLTKTDGTKLTRTITASSEASATEESLTVDSVWPSDITVAEIALVEIFELVRFDTDEFRIDHISAIGDAQIAAPVRSVFD